MANHSKVLIKFLNEELSIEAVLSILKVIFKDLDDEDSLKWVEKELTGYNLDDILPQYRIHYGYLMYINGIEKIIPDCFIPKQYKQEILTVPIFEGVEALQKFIKQPNDKMRIHDLGKIKKIFGETLKFNNDSLFCTYIDTVRLIGTLGTIKDKIIDVIYVLEKKGCDIDELDISKVEEKEKLILNVTQIINNVDSTNSCVNIGDDNTFKNIKN